jgi:NADH-quinone oxidoreductase subunit N
VGFIILSLVFLQERSSMSVSLFYLFIYVITTLGSFSILLIFCKDATRELENLSDLKGFATTNPLIAFFLAIFLFSMAGIPPLVGFYAKLLVLNNVVSSGLLWLAVFSVLMTVVGLFYYLRVVKIMYFDTTEVNSYVYTVSMSKFGVFLVSLNSLIILLLGVYPYPVLWICSFICNN